MEHPLINKIDSSHYDSVGNEPAIKRFERCFTVSELKAWAKITHAKYTDPARANKGQVEADERKAETYKNYLEMLEQIPYTLWNLSAEKAYSIMGWEIKY